jgi:hypothetical protein
MERTPAQRAPILALRIPEADLEAIERARAIMGDGTMSAYARQCLLMVSRAIIEASGRLGNIGASSGSWDRCWMEGTLERKEGA